LEDATARRFMVDAFPAADRFPLRRKTLLS
jgi:hypothetical protein